MEKNQFEQHNQMHLHFISKSNNNNDIKYFPSASHVSLYVVLFNLVFPLMPHMLSVAYFHIGVIFFGLACWAALPSQWRASIRPFIQFKPMFSPCQINSHPLGQCCVRVLRWERCVWVSCTNNNNMHGSPQLAPLGVLQRACLSLSCCTFPAVAHCRTDRASSSLLRNRPNWNWPFQLDDTAALHCRTRSGGYHLRPWLMTIGPAGSNPATMKECFLNPEWYPEKQNDSSQGACVLTGHLNVWMYWVTWDWAAKRERNKQQQNRAQRVPRFQGVSQNSRLILISMMSLCFAPNTLATALNVNMTSFLFFFSTPDSLTYRTKYCK